MYRSLHIRVKSGDNLARVFIELVNTQGFGEILTAATENRTGPEGI